MCHHNDTVFYINTQQFCTCFGSDHYRIHILKKIILFFFITYQDKNQSRKTMFSSSSQVAIQDVDFNQLEHGTLLDNTSHQSASSNGSISTSSLGKRLARSSITGQMKQKSKGLFGTLKQNSPNATTYQTEIDYLLFRK